ncbi:hypothetical protein [Rheinheimera fenheensis]|uniref:hypothetical protein n=1 Tax=Rheinheimera fenheensis TaxID=3152295 RepID=UPI003260548B
MSNEENNQKKPLLILTNGLVESLLSGGRVSKSLSADEVELILKETMTLSNKMMHNLVAIELVEGYRALDCNSMKELIEKYYPGKYKTIHHNFNAARVAYSIGGKELLGKYPDDAMRAMKHLSVEQRKEIYEYLVQSQNATSESVRVTIKLVEQAIEERIPSKIKTKKLKHSSWSKIITNKANKFFETLMENEPAGIALLAAVIGDKLRPDQVQKLAMLIQTKENGSDIKEGL